MTLLLLNFVLLLAVGLAAYLYGSQRPPSERAVEERLGRIRPIATAFGGTRGAEQPSPSALAARLLSWLEHRLAHLPFTARLKTLIEQSGSDRSSAALLYACACAGLLGGVLAWVLLPSVALRIFLAALGAAAPYLKMRFRRKRRIAAFNAALPDAIDLMSRSLIAGHAMSSAIEVVAEQSPEPVRTEFREVYQQQKFGLPMREALLRLSERMPSCDLRFVTTAVLVQRETGGDLTDILDRTTNVIRERVRIQNEVKVYTAQGRLTGWILSLLPVVMLGLLNLVSPGYSHVLFHDPLGQKLAYAGFALIVSGGLIIRKIVDIKV